MLSALPFEVVDAGDEKGDCIGAELPRVERMAVRRSRMSKSAGKNDKEPPPYYILIRGIIIIIPIGQTIHRDNALSY